LLRCYGNALAWQHCLFNIPRLYVFLTTAQLDSLYMRWARARMTVVRGMRYMD
jgi:hypothetical protein